MVPQQLVGPAGQFCIGVWGATPRGKLNSAMTGLNRAAGAARPPWKLGGCSTGAGQAPTAGEERGRQMFWGAVSR